MTPTISRRLGARPLGDACDDPAMSSFAVAERAQLVEALRAVDADAPTLCEGWTARDLAAHIVSRERRPDSTPGLVLAALAGWTDRVRNGYAVRPYPTLIEMIATGPPWNSPFALPGVDAAANLVEFLIHTEDVRRARPGWTPRELSGELEESLWHGLRTRGRFFFRSAPVEVVLALPDGRRHAVAGDGPPVTVVGRPAELLLYASGRTGHALVEFDGTDDAVRRFRELRLRL
jgi:uncharacterized protein (TIGR03085 family)